MDEQPPTKRVKLRNEALDANDSGECYIFDMIYILKCWLNVIKLCEMWRNLHIKSDELKN